MYVCVCTYMCVSWLPYVLNVINYAPDSSKHFFYVSVNTYVCKYRSTLHLTCPLPSLPLSPLSPAYIRNPPPPSLPTPLSPHPPLCAEGTHWLGYWGKHMKGEAFKGLKEYQKVNHFPGSFAIGRKDRLWRSLAHMQSLYGKKVWCACVRACVCVHMYMFTCCTPNLPPSLLVRSLTLSLRRLCCPLTCAC